MLNDILIATVMSVNDVSLIMATKSGDTDVDSGDDTSERQCECNSLMIGDVDDNCD